MFPKYILALGTLINPINDIINKHESFSTEDAPSIYVNGKWQYLDRRTLQAMINEGLPKENIKTIFKMLLQYQSDSERFDFFISEGFNKIAQQYKDIFLEAAEDIYTEEEINEIISEDI